MFSTFYNTLCQSCEDSLVDLSSVRCFRLADELMCAAAETEQQPMWATQSSLRETKKIRTKKKNIGPSQKHTLYEIRKFIYDEFAPTDHTTNNGNGSSALTVEFPLQSLYHDLKQCHPKHSLDLTNFNLTKHFFNFFASHCAHSRELILSHTYNLNLSKLTQIQHFGMLSLLHLQGSITLTVEVAFVIASFSRLVELNISENEIQPKALMTLLPRLSILRTLICQKCTGLDDFSMQAIAVAVQQHRHLLHLDLSHVISFSDEGALALFTISMNILQDINLSGCNSLTSLTMTAFRKRMSVLKKLNLSAIRHLGPSAFELLSEGCLFVTHLDLSHNPSLEDTGLTLIGKRCHHLVTLNLNHCINISDDGVTGFVDNHLEDNMKPTLTQLDLSGCVKCSAGTGYTLSRLGSSLVTLKLNCLSQITAPSMKALWERLNHLENFEMSADLRRYFLLSPPFSSSLSLSLSVSLSLWSFPPARVLIVAA
jgi:hypothetical protein